MMDERPEFGTGKTKEARFAFGGMKMELPVFDRPISVRENFYRVARRENPMWIPFPATEVQELHMAHLYDKGPAGYQLGPILSAKESRYVYHDAFGNSWTFDKNAGGACMTIGTRVCDDILKWEEQITFPDLHEWNLDEHAENFMKNEYDPERALIMDIYHGPFQSLADLLGGFSEALEAMFVEPEATRAFFDRYADWLIWLIDRLSGLYPADLFCVHDDWGTERDTFFSPQMVEDLLFEPTKKIIDHVHSLGKLYTFHNCGKNDRFMPYYCELAPDFMQLQRRVNDTPAYKKMYGDRIGFHTGIENFVPRAPYTKEEVTKLVRDSLDIFAPGGGFLPSVMCFDPEMLWTMASEVYCYSRELLKTNNNIKNLRITRLAP